MGILVFCPNGHVFESRALKISGNVKNLRLKGNRETCPVCGAMAEIMDGEFEVLDGTIRLLMAPGITRERLWGLRQVVAELKDARATPEQTAAALDEVVPNLSRFLPRTSGDLAVWLTVLLMLLMWMDSRSDEPLDPAEIIETIMEHQNDPPTTAPSAPPPALPTTPPDPPAAQGPPGTAPPAPSAP